MKEKVVNNGKVWRTLVKVLDNEKIHIPCQDNSVLGDKGLTDFFYHNPA